MITVSDPTGDPLYVDWPTICCDWMRVLLPLNALLFEGNWQMLGSERRENRRLGQGNIALAASIRLVSGRSPRLREGERWPQG
jgi:hypothetical protein